MHTEVGDKSYRNTVGPHGLGRKNQRGQMLIDFCERNGLAITSTGFKKPKRILYTWTASGNRKRHQLDYMLVKHRFSNSMKDVQTLPEAHTDSEHNLLVAKICTTLKKITNLETETWTFLNVDQKYMKSAEMWCWRRFKKISWTDRVRNEVLQRVKEKRNILQTVKRRKANCFGHILRRNCLLKHVIEG
jgi:hypothetical protein